ncbi:unnamed protein product [Thelazia callipaeda]|uniref:Secreted protein n=1 Tax=Thelazia callipaeda TaxID=103827 RepID=A0A0N5CLW0_THECL|nr:unnamed protein product [Thelazia callipaeda]
MRLGVGRQVLFVCGVVWCGRRWNGLGGNSEVGWPDELVNSVMLFVGSSGQPTTLLFCVYVCMGITRTICIFMEEATWAKLPQVLLYEVACTA